MYRLGAQGLGKQGTQGKGKGREERECYSRRGTHRGGVNSTKGTGAIPSAHRIKGKGLIGISQVVHKKGRKVGKGGKGLIKPGLVARWANSQPECAPQRLRTNQQGLTHNESNR